MRVSIGDVRLSFDCDGPEYVLQHGHAYRRPTAVLLPGGPGQSHLHHKRLCPLPSDLVRIVHLEHRGTGHSDQSDVDHWTLETWVSDVAAFCDALDIEHPIIAGTSFGAIVALAYAQAYPDHPSSLILISGVPRFDRDASLRVFERLGGRAARDVADRFMTDPNRRTGTDYLVICQPLYVRTQDPSHVLPLREDSINVELLLHWSKGEARTLDLRSKLKDIRCPTLILAGSDDPIAPASLAAEIADGLPPQLAQLHVINDCGHGCFWDAPDESMRIVRGFVDANT